MFPACVALKVDPDRLPAMTYATRNTRCLTTCLVSIPAWGQIP